MPRCRRRTTEFACLQKFVHEPKEMDCLYRPTALQSAWRDGTRPITMSPLEFMQRLAALVPRPPRRGDAETEESTRAVDFHKTPRKLTPSRPGDIVAHREEVGEEIV